MQRPLDRAALLAAMLRERFGDLATIEKERSISPSDTRTTKPQRSTS